MESDIGLILFKNKTKNKTYIARSTNINSYVNQVKSLLDRNLFENIEFQKDFNENNDLDISFIRLNNLEEAILLQRDFLLNRTDEFNFYNRINLDRITTGMRLEYEIIHPNETLTVTPNSFISDDLRAKGNKMSSFPMLRIVYESKCLGKCNALANTISLHKGIRLPKYVPGIYIIQDFIYGNFYIGSSLSISSRISQHSNHLLRNIHRNKNLQLLHNRIDKKFFEIKFIVFDKDFTKNDLLLLEQELLDCNKDNSYMLNISTDAFKFGKGLTYVRTEQQKQAIGKMNSKKISVNGAVFRSATEASKSLNLSISKISAMATSDEEKYNNVFYV